MIEIRVNILEKEVHLNVKKIFKGMPDQQYDIQEFHIKLLKRFPHYLKLSIMMHSRKSNNNCHHHTQNLGSIGNYQQSSKKFPNKHLNSQIIISISYGY